MTAPVIAIVGVRGGSLVTSVAANVAGLMAAAGNSTLLVDLDPSGAVGFELGLGDAVPPTIEEARPGLDVLRAGTALSESDISGALERARGRYDVVIVDVAGALRRRGFGLTFADWVVVPTRPDRAALAALAALGVDLADLAGSSGVPVLGVLVVGAPPRPRSVLVRARRTLTATLDPRTTVLASTVRSAPAVSWWARERGLLLHELTRQLDREALDAATVEDAVGLARDYAELADELVARLHPEQDVPTSANVPCPSGPSGV